MDQSAPMPSTALPGRHAAGVVGRATRRDPEAVLARAGTLELRLAATDRDVRRAQRLRFEVFYEQGRAIPDAASAAARRDLCAFDPSCDHLLVVDTGAPAERVVGTYRLMRGDVAARRGGFYSATAFEIAPLLARHLGARFLELGRSCVHADYRARRAIELLWQGIGIYAARHGIDVLIGCSSLPGVDPEDLAAPLSFAFHHAAAAAAWQVEPVASRAARMDWIARDAIDARRSFASLPPLMKAYMRAGGTFASRAAIDRQFGTTDLFTVLRLDAANPRYMAHFAPAHRAAA